MFLQIILTLALLVLGLALNKLYFQPKKLVNFYKKTFQSKFKVYAYPFYPLQVAEYAQGSKDQLKYKDSFKTYKDVCSEFDIALSTSVDKVQINLISPKLMQAFFQLDHQKYYRKNELIVNGLRRMVGEALTFSYGEVWKTKRRIITKMLNFTYIKSLVPKIYKIVRQKIKEFLSKSHPNSDGYFEVDLFDLTTQIASTVVLQLFFGGGDININDLRIKDKPINQHMRKLLQFILKQLMTNPLVAIFGQKYCKLGVTQLDRQVNVLLTDFNAFTFHYITKRFTELKKEYEQGKQNPQVYKDLIEAYYVEEILIKGKEINQEFIQILSDEFANTFAAGTDTTSHAALMAIYHTYKDQGIKQELIREIKKNIPSLDQLDYDSFKHCILLQAILTENTRIYSTANGIFPRQAIQDHTITVDGQSFPILKGTLVNIQTITTHFKKSIFKDPHQFRPHRFIGKDGKIVNPEPFTIMNFSAGTRSCVGRQLALTQEKIIMAVLANFYDIKVDDSAKQMVFSAFAYNIKNVKFLIKPLQR